MKSLMITFPDLTPMDYYPDPNPALHLIVYSVNQKGRSEPIILENIPINEAEKRSVINGSASLENIDPYENSSHKYEY
uniref:Uncharacterized protein n=1 Tax=Glossina brevipalpis TaxID=37001 RepID=A0A1A9WTW3_9MUSC